MELEKRVQHSKEDSRGGVDNLEVKLGVQDANMNPGRRITNKGQSWANTLLSGVHRTRALPPLQGAPRHCCKVHGHPCKVHHPNHPEKGENGVVHCHPCKVHCPNYPERSENGVGHRHPCKVLACCCPVSTACNE
jgi:hypothetical protein